MIVQKFKILGIVAILIPIFIGSIFLIVRGLNKEVGDSNVDGGWNTASVIDSQESGEDLEIENSLEIRNWKLEINKKYGFSFQYPEGMNVSSFEEGEGEIILVQGPSTSLGQVSGFQIYIIPFEEPIEGAITPERIHQDLPNLAIESPQEAVLSGGIRALIFFSEDPDLGRLREVWIIHGGYLYQITASAELDTFLSRIMSSWEFK